MGSVNVTLRLDEDVKREFDSFCEKVGLNITVAFNMFVRATLRTRSLPFPITDIQDSHAILARGKEALMEAQAQAQACGASDMSLDEINELIAETRQEMSSVDV